MKLILPSAIKEWSEHYVEIYNLTKAGYSPLDIYQKLAKDGPSKTIRELALKIYSFLKLGRPLDHCLNRLGDEIPILDRAIITSGIKAGRTEKSYLMLTDYYTQMAAARSALMKQMVYPLVLIHGGILAFPFDHLALIMKSGLFAFLKLKLLPLSALWLILTLPLTLSAGKSGQSFSQFFAPIFDRLPLFGPARRLGSLARFSRALEGLVAAGFVPVESWPLAAKASGSQRILQDVELMVPSLRAGKKLTELLTKSTVFPDHFKSRLQTAEMAGQMESTLKDLGDYYTQAASGKIQTITEWIPRIIYFIVVIVLAINIVKSMSQALDGIDPDKIK